MSRLADVLAASMLYRLKPAPAVSKFVWGFDDDDLNRIRRAWKEAAPESRKLCLDWQLSPVEESDERLRPLRELVAEKLTQEYKDGGTSSETIGHLKNLVKLNLYDLAAFVEERWPGELCKISPDT